MMIARVCIRLMSSACVPLMALAANYATAATPLPETRMEVTLPVNWAGDASGRLIVFAKPVKTDDKPADVAEVDTDPFSPQPVSVAARDITTFGKGRSVTIDTNETAFPASFATLPPGEYHVQAVLDRNGDYNYDGRGPGDLVSAVTTVHLPEQGMATIALDHVLPDADRWDFSKYKPETRAMAEAAKPHLHEVLFQSPALTAFSGRATTIKAWVLTPPGYGPHAAMTWPTVFDDGGFGSNHNTDIMMASHIWELEAQKSIPPMIWVFLDHSGPTGTNEFADSVNNGPWGQALTTEFIPALEKNWRMDARPSGRFLTGHSSGGWSALWLQVRYPTLFGGCWPTSPDPSDFHNFVGVDLYASNANMYVKADGSAYPMSRDHDKLISTISDFARLEAVLGHDGGQFRSFEWVFSPRGADGTPMPMFDRMTGAVDPAVIAYWRDHYDIAHLIERYPTKTRRVLDGKVHLTVGTADTYYLDGSARLLDAAMSRAGVKASFVYIPNKTHIDLYVRGADKLALMKDIAWAMYTTARPGTVRPLEKAGVVAP